MLKFENFSKKALKTISYENDENHSTVATLSSLNYKAGCFTEKKEIIELLITENISENNSNCYGFNLECNQDTISMQYLKYDSKQKLLIVLLHGYSNSHYYCIGQNKDLELGVILHHEISRITDIGKYVTTNIKKVSDTKKYVHWENGTIAHVDNEHTIVTIPTDESSVNIKIKFPLGKVKFVIEH